MSRPFVPFSETAVAVDRQTLTSFMVADSDPDDYGKITVYEMPSGQADQRPVAGQHPDPAEPARLVHHHPAEPAGLAGRSTATCCWCRWRTRSSTCGRSTSPSDSNPAPALKAVDRGGRRPGRRCSPRCAAGVAGAVPGLRPADGRDASSLAAPDRRATAAPTELRRHSSSTTTTTAPGGSTSTTVPPATGDETVDQLIALAHAGAQRRRRRPRRTATSAATRPRSTRPRSYLDQAQRAVGARRRRATPADDGAVHHRPDDHDRRHARLGRAGRSAPQRSGVVRCSAGAGPGAAVEGGHEQLDGLGEGVVGVAPVGGGVGAGL